MLRARSQRAALAGSSARLARALRDAVSPVERRVRGRIIDELARSLALSQGRLGRTMSAADTDAEDPTPLQLLELAAAHLPARLAEYRDANASFEAFVADHAVATRRSRMTSARASGVADACRAISPPSIATSTSTRCGNGTPSGCTAPTCATSC